MTKPWSKWIACVLWRHICATCSFLQTLCTSAIHRWLCRYFYPNGKTKQRNRKKRKEKRIEITSRFFFFISFLSLAGFVRQPKCKQWKRKRKQWSLSVDKYLYKMKAKKARKAMGHNLVAGSKHQRTTLRGTAFFSNALHCCAAWPRPISLSVFLFLFMFHFHILWCFGVCSCSQHTTDMLLFIGFRLLSVWYRI